MIVEIGRAVPSGYMGVMPDGRIILFPTHDEYLAALRDWAQQE